MSDHPYGIFVDFQKLNPEAKLPERATPGASGYDLIAIESVELLPGKRALVGTGIALAIPRDWEAQIRPRSGLALKHGVTVLNTPGTIDSDYRGEIKVLLINHGNQPVHLDRGTRIAQMVFCPVQPALFSEVAILGDTPRGAGGFGSTGTR